MTERASRISAGGDSGGEVIRIDIVMGSVYLAMVPCRDSIDKRPSARLPSRTGFIPMSEARAFWVAAPGRGEIRAQPLRPPGPGELLIRTRRERDQQRHRKPRVPRRGAARANGSGCAARFRRASSRRPSNTATPRSGIVEDGPAD